ncbi:MAG: AmmeMemoRadiSam system protein A [Nitrospirae bacterium]|nr:MAG: AmmeMemoRadiSam system protein A [Nitrospirota bacterium]
MHPLASLAKKTVETFVNTGKVPTVPEQLPPEFLEKAGVFVSIKKHGGLRGCIGTFSPVTSSIAAETIANAISAATGDPRFSPVTADELDDLVYSVDVLTPPERVTDIRELDPKRFGIILSSGHKRGLLLPDLEGVDTVEEQIRITQMKAGIFPGEKTELSRFTVQRYS